MASPSQDTELDVELGILETEVYRSEAQSAPRKGIQTSFSATAGEETRKTKRAAKRAAKKKATIQLSQERDLEQGEHGAEPEPSPPSSSQRLSSKLRRSLFLDSALPFKDKGVQTPEPSETEADSQLGSEPINDAINEAKDKKDDEENEKNAEKNVHGTKENIDEKTNKNSPNESTDGTQKSDKKKDQKEKDKEKKPEDGKQTEDKGRQADEEKASSLKHGKFSTDGRTQEFVYIPTADFSEDVNSRSADIFDQVLRHWNLARPQLLIKFQSGFAHPKKLLARDEIDKFESIVANSNEEPEIYKYFKHFLLCVQNRNFAIAEEGGEMLDEKEEALNLLNEFLFKSLSNLIDVIVRAAVRNRCWILVEGGPNSGLLLLKQAAERCKESPVVLVLDGVRRKRFAYAELNEKIKDYAGHSEVQNLDDLVKLEASSEPEDNKIVKEVIDKMRKRMRMKGWEKFKKKHDDQEAKEDKGRRPTVATVGTVATAATDKSVNTVQSQTSQTLKEMRKWESKDQDEVEETRLQAALMTARLLRHAKPIDKPDMEPLKLTTSFWDLKEEKEGWELRSSKSLDSGKVRWNHWHFRGGTHYIFTDLSYSELMTDCLAPSGSIFLGGGEGSKEALMRMLVNGEPVVCLDNTGRVTQDFVRCHKFLCDSLFREVDENDKKPQDEKAKMRFRKERSKGTHELGYAGENLVKKVNTDFLKGDIKRKTVFKQLTFDGSDGTLGREDMIAAIMEKLKEVKEFSKPELCELFLTYLRRGLQITKLCVVMDPLDPRECSGGHTEDRLSRCLSNFVILASNDTSDFADVEAVKAASRLEDQLMGAASVESWWAGSMTYMLLALNFFSLLLALARNSAGPQFLTGMPAPLLRWGLPGVSAASTFISGLVGRFRFMLRWSKARSAAAQLEAEIWKFRTRVCEYAVVGTRDEEDGSIPAGELGQAITRERKQDVTRSWFRANVNSIFNTAMEEMGTSSLHGHGFDKLPSNVRSTKYPFLCWCCRRQKKPRQDERGQIVASGHDGALSQNDLSRYGHIGVDEYYHQRTLSVFERMKNQAFWLTFLQGALESLVLLLGTFGVLLSTFDQTEIAMICLSLAANLQALERFHALSNRLDAANAGERDLICAWQDWSAMEPMQRRFQASVSRLVLTTEGVNVALTIAATAGVRQSLPTSTKPN
mmetsp:Transcript_61571/g.124990  ORF Transcript_61571/g.124990 Transcript_61571/m.124990 type:complete len:1174 (+) Transcript_61571:29-3550(+)